IPTRWRPTLPWCAGCWPGSSRAGPGCRSTRSSRTGPTTTSTGSATTWPSGCRASAGPSPRRTPRRSGCPGSRRSCPWPCRCSWHEGARPRATPSGGRCTSGSRVRTPTAPSATWSRRPSTWPGSCGRCAGSTPPAPPPAPAGPGGATCPARRACPPLGRRRPGLRPAARLEPVRRAQPGPVPGRARGRRRLLAAGSRLGPLPGGGRPALLLGLQPRHGPSGLLRRRPGARRPVPGLAALHAAQALALLPEVDDQVVGGVADPDVDQLGDVDPEQVGAAGVLAGAELPQPLGVVDLDGPAGQLGVAGPGGGVVGRVERGAVEGQARVAAQGEGLAGAGHHAEPQLAVAEGGLDPADAGGAVPAQCGQDLVLVGVEGRPRPGGQLGRGRLDLVPARHGKSLVGGRDGGGGRGRGGSGGAGVGCA